MRIPLALARLMAPDTALYTIENGRPFLADIAQVLVNAYRGVEQDIADLTVFVPTKRAARALADAIFDAGHVGAQSVFLPKILALGEVSEEELIVGSTAAMDALTSLPAANPMDRRILLAQMIRARHFDIDWATSFRAADELGRFLDSFYLEGVDPSALNDLVTDDVSAEAAQHWQKGLEFIRLVTENWPAILAEQSVMDGADRSNRLGLALAEQVKSSDRFGPTIIAGSLGTVAGSKALIGAISRSPRGLAILPGFEPGLDDSEWAAIDRSHPQAVFRDLLSAEFPDISRQEIEVWPCDTLPARNEDERQSLLSLALKPSHVTDGWYTDVKNWDRQKITNACGGISRIVARTEDEEALFIALAIREALEDPAKTIMVVTPDRVLAQRVSEKLGAWDIKVDDTGGVPLRGTYRGTFFRIIAQWLEDPSDPVRFMAMLNHPITAFGQSAAVWGTLIREIDRVLRGRRRTWSLADLTDVVENIRWPEQLNDGQATAYRLLSGLRAFHEKWRAAPTLAGKIDCHIEIAEALAATADVAGPDRLWIHEDGEGLVRHLETLQSAQGAIAQEIASDESYPDLFDALLAGVVVRKRGGHSRIRIFGLLEARLQTADFVILGALNEGVWPDGRDGDPFLSRPMREKLGLPTTETLIGRAAHDFVQAASAPTVLLSRSARRGGSPAAPSRWMVRLENLLAHREVLSKIDCTQTFRRWGDHLHRPESIEGVAPPAPKPSLAHRPKRYTVSDFEQLLRDPYSIFARKILGLRVWDPLAMDPTVADRGSFFHLCAEKFAQKYPSDLPGDLESSIQKIVKETFAAGRFEDRIWSDWIKSRENFTNFMMAFEKEVRRDGLLVGTELSGALTFSIGSIDVEVYGKADRVDRLSNKEISIVDFKSSEKSPTNAQQKNFSPQLFLLAMMVEKGRIEGVSDNKCGRIAFLNFRPPKGDSVFEEKSSIDGPDLQDALSSAERLVKDVLQAYLVNEHPYLSQPRPEFCNEYGRYDHLARRAEWASEMGDE